MAIPLNLAALSGPPEQDNATSKLEQLYRVKGLREQSEQREANIELRQQQLDLNRANIDQLRATRAQTDAATKALEVERELANEKSLRRVAGQKLTAARLIDKQSRGEQMSVADFIEADNEFGALNAKEYYAGLEGQSKALKDFQTKAEDIHDELAGIAARIAGSGMPDEDRKTAIAQGFAGLANRLQGDEQALAFLAHAKDSGDFIDTSDAGLAKIIATSKLATGEAATAEANRRAERKAKLDGMQTTAQLMSQMATLAKTAQEMRRPQLHGQPIEGADGMLSQIVVNPNGTFEALPLGLKGQQKFKLTEGMIDGAPAFARVDEQGRAFDQFAQPLGGRFTPTPEKAAKPTESELEYEDWKKYPGSAAFRAKNGESRTAFKEWERQQTAANRPQAVPRTPFQLALENNPNLTAEEWFEMQANAPTTQERNRKASLETIRPVLDSISELSEKINTGAGLMAKLKGVAEKAAAKVNYDDDVAEYESFIAGFTPLVAQAVGHDGRLTEQDVASVRELFPKPGDSKTLRDRKIRNLERLLGGAGKAQPEKTEKKDAKKDSAQDLIDGINAAFGVKKK